MTLQWIPLGCLAPYPENSNRMPPRLMEKLKAMRPPMVVGKVELESEKQRSPPSKQKAPPSYGVTKGKKGNEMNPEKFEGK